MSSSFFAPALEAVELCYLDSIGPVLQHLTSQAVTGLPLTRLHIENCSFREQDLLSLLYRLAVLSVLELVDVHDVGSGILQVRIEAPLILSRRLHTDTPTRRASPYPSIKRGHART